MNFRNMKRDFTHHKLFSILGYLRSICCLVCCRYGMLVSFFTPPPSERAAKYAALDPLPRGLSSIDKLLHDRIPADSLNHDTISQIAVYRYQGHTLYEVIKGQDTLTIPDHVTDTLFTRFVAAPTAPDAWKDSLRYGAMPLDKYQLDYRRIIARYDGQVSRIEWNSFDTIPIYIIGLLGHDEPIYINATTPYVKPFYLTESDVVEAVQTFCQCDSVSAEQLNQYDDYYLDLEANLTLPVWKAVADDYTYYINPRTGSFQSFQTQSKWLFVKNHAFQALRYKIFAKHPERWTITLWAILIVGTLLSLVGIIKSGFFLKRLSKVWKGRRFFR